MSNYEPIVPTSIPFYFHGASIEIETEDSGRGIVDHIKGSGSHSELALSHFVGIKSDKQLIVDQFDFTGLKDGIHNGWMSVKEFKIESSMDEETWDTLYSGTIPFAQSYTQSCEFKPIKCKSIRCTILSTYSPGGQYATWFSGKNFKIYGTLALPEYKIYTNPDAYGVPKTEGDR